MLKIYLARHGQNIDNLNGILNGHRDYPLTDVGEQQAHEVGEKIKESGLVFDYIFTSPLQRAVRTAGIITKVIDGPLPIIMPLLIERDFGVMTGVEQVKIEELCAPDIIRTETITYFLNPNGAETFPDLLLRARAILADLTRQYDNKSILLVTHGDIGKMLYVAFYDLSWKDVLRQFHFGNSELLLLSEDSKADDTHIFRILQHST